MSTNEKSPESAGEGSNKTLSPRTNLEDASKEDLIRQIKKQLHLLHKTKTKCDELNMKCATLEENLKESHQNEKEAKEIAEKEYSILKTELEGELKKIREADEQIECMKRKENSLTSALTCLQEEINKLSAENNDLKHYQNELESDKERRQLEINRYDVELENLKLEKEKLMKIIEENDEISSILKSENENLGKKTLEFEVNEKSKLLEIKSLQEELDEVVKEKDLFKVKCQDFDDMAVQLDELRVCLEEMQNENVLLHAELKNAASERDQLLFQENREEQCTILEEQVQNLESEIEDLKNKLEGAEFEAEEMKAKLEEKIESCGLDETKAYKMELELFKNREKQCLDIMDDLFSTGDKFEFNCDESENFFVNKLNQVKVKMSEMQAEMEKLNFEIQDKKIELIELQEKMSLNEYSPRNNQFDEIESLKEEKQLLEDEFSKLKKMDLKHEDQLFACEEEMKVVKNLLKEKEEELGSVKFELERISNQFQVELSSREEEVGVLVREKNELEEKIGKLESDLENLGNVIERKFVEDKEEEVKNELNFTRLECKRLESEIMALKMELKEEKVKNLSLFEEQRGIFESEIRKLCDILEEEKDKIEKVENFKEFQEKCKEFEVELKLSSEEITILRNQKIALEEEANNLNLIVDLKKGLEMELEEEKRKNVMNLLEIERKLNLTNEELELVKNERTKFEDEVNKLKLETERKNLLEEELNKLKTELEESKNLNSKNSGLVIKLNSANEEIRELKVEKENLKVEINRLIYSIEEIKNEILEKTKEFETKYYDDVCKLQLTKEEIETLRKENEKLIGELEIIKNSKDELEQKIVQLTTENENFLLRADITEIEELKTNLENCQEKLESEQNISTNLKKELDKTTLDLAMVKSQLSNLQAENDCNKSEISSLMNEKKETIAGLNAKISILTFEKDQISIKLEEITRDCKEVKEKNRLVSMQLEQEKERHHKTINQLEQVQQQFKQQKLTNLEFADYEKLVDDLNQQVKKFQEEIEKLNQEVNSKEEINRELRIELEQVGVQRTKLDERTNKLKLLLVKLKKELAEAKRNEIERSNTEVELRCAIEFEKQKSETHQMEIATLSGENQKLQESIKTMKESHQRITRALEARITSTQSELSLTRQEFDKCQVDYENYKVRVHSVLKQQKNKTLVTSKNEMEENEREVMEKAMDQLKLKLQEENDKLVALKTEHACLQDDYERLSMRHEKLLEEFRTKEEEFREKLECLTLEENSFKDQHMEMIKELRRQNEAVTAAYKEQMQNLTQEHERVVKDLKAQLNSTEQEMWKWQREKSNSKEEMELFDVANTERQEGEGSENTEPTLGTPVQVDQMISTDLSLEQLLNPEKAPSICSNLSQQEYENLEKQFVICVRKVDHLTELLNESEASNMRFSEQTRVLKEEIRRLERNQEREEHTSNMEYLKNIILKFVTLSGGDERERLVPVLTMMLRLSPQEKAQLNFIAKGHEQPQSDSENVGWGSYLPRWSGLV